jgi:hypothetical protein
MKVVAAMKIKLPRPPPMWQRGLMRIHVRQCEIMLSKAFENCETLHGKGLINPLEGLPVPNPLLEI